MSLAAHLRRPQGRDIEHRTVGREEHVQLALEIILVDFLGEVLDVDGLVRRECR